MGRVCITYPLYPPLIHEGINVTIENHWLVNHAADNIWCDPNNDNRITAQLARLSSPEGETYGMQVTEYSIKLPTEDRWYHVYQLGNLSCEYVGIKELGNAWARLDRVVNEYGLNIKVYSDAGRTFPLSLAWIRQLPNDNVIVALGTYEAQINLSVTPMYICFYDGKYRHTADYDSKLATKITGVLARNQVELENTFRLYQSEREKLGNTTAFVNGYPVADLNSNSAEVWDYIEVYRDSLVKETHFFDVKHLATFTSKLDKERKYLIHPPKGCEALEFVNDLDIFLFCGNTGCYLPIHKPQTLRQLTHHDYSISSHFIQELSNANGWTSLDDIQIKINIRNSGIGRELVYEHTQLRELYKMDDRCIANAMVGMNSTVVEWQAAELENSLYCRLAAARYYDITKDFATDTYGYNAVSKYVSDTPVKITDNVFQLPPLLKGMITVYEYDEDGLYLEHHVVEHMTDGLYRPSNPNCKLIEPLIGEAKDTASVYYNATDFTTIKGINYRFYKCPMKNGEVPYRKFIDITDTDEVSIGSDGKVIWNIDATRYMPVVVSDEVILHYTRDANLADGVIDFNVTSDRTGNGFSIPYAPKVLDLSIGKYQLIPEVDYHVEWPRIVIYSKERLGAEEDFATIPVTIRAIGIAPSYESPKPGYVVNNLLSNNNRFDVRDGKVVRFIVGGKLKHRSDIAFREDTAIGIDGLANGTPYVINDTMIPLRTIVSDERSIYELKEWDEELDKRIEEYLTLFIPQPPNVEHNPILTRYRTFSPLLNKIIHDLKADLLRPVEDDERNLISTQQLDKIMVPYLDYLDFDPIRLKVDDNYVVTEPHAFTSAIELTPLEFSLVERINDRYLGNKIILNKLLSIKG